MVFNFEQVHNYYERLVFEGIAARAELHPDFSMDMLSDVACVALNRLPSKYVRHDVDLMFYLSEPERRAIDVALDTEIQAAFKFVIQRLAKNPR